MVVGDQQADFEEQRSGVDQTGDALARGQLAVAVLLLNLLRPAAKPQAVFQIPKFLDQMPHTAAEA